jgi:hypothetical protein
MTNKMLSSIVQCLCTWYFRLTSLLNATSEVYSAVLYLFWSILIIFCVWRSQKKNTIPRYELLIFKKAFWQEIRRSFFQIFQCVYEGLSKNTVQITKVKTFILCVYEVLMCQRSRNKSGIGAWSWCHSLLVKILLLTEVATWFSRNSVRVTKGRAWRSMWNAVTV